jgi:diguanylate cyclase (GGDEF)-like protein/PAS domain S-box-containing protein
LKARRLELLGGLIALAVYALLFPELYHRVGVLLLVLVLPGLLLLSWALGLAGAVAVGVLNIGAQAGLLWLYGEGWSPPTLEALALITGSGLIACTVSGLFRWQSDRRALAEQALVGSQARAGRHALELALLSQVRGVAEDLEPAALMTQVAGVLGAYPRFRAVATYLAGSGGQLELVATEGKTGLGEGLPGGEESVARATRLAQITLEREKQMTRIAVPLLARGRVRGVLLVAGPALDERDVELVEGVVAQLNLSLDRAQVYRELRDQERLYHTLLEAMPHPIAMTDGATLLYLNGVGVAALGYERFEEIVGQPLTRLIHPDSLARVAERAQRILAGELDAFEEMKVLRKGGEAHEVEAQGTLFTVGGVSQIMVVVRDVQERKSQQARIEFLAYHDPLTDLPNRRKLWEEAERLLVADRRKRDTPALIYLDLDNFKMVNDTLGHAAGDELLRQVAARIKDELRQGDILARLGGDEFAILLATADRTSAQVTARRILGVFNTPFVVGDHSLHVLGSLGVALYPEHGDTLDELARAADVAMYQAKQGRTGVAVYDPEQDRNSLERLQLVQELRSTIRKGQFLIQYQPILNIEDKFVSKWEALVRWAHPTRGLLRPAEFVPLAEEAGLIGELDLAVLRQAVRDHKSLGGELTINFSAATLAHPNWVREVVRALVDEGMQPGRLWLEITESALLPERQRWLGGLVALRGLGVRVALDDFGMGYSSLSHLKQVPVDLIKIDRSFVQDIGEGKVSEEILEAVLGLAAAFGLKTLAEGVENRLQLDWLARHGCNFAQGYYVGLPMSPEQAAEKALTRVL